MCHGVVRVVKFSIIAPDIICLIASASESAPSTSAADHRLGKKGYNGQ